jgi:hypothetical protein
MPQLTTLGLIGAGGNQYTRTKSSGVYRPEDNSRVSYYRHSPDNYIHTENKLIFTENPSSGYPHYRSLNWSPDGLLINYVYENDGNTYIFKTHAATKSFDCTSLSLTSDYDWEITKSNSNHIVYGLCFADDGKKIYVCLRENSSSARIDYYQIKSGQENNVYIVNTTNYEYISSATGISISNVSGIKVSLDGSKLYLGDSTNSRIYQYSLSPNYSISSITQDSNYLNCTSILASSKGTISDFHFDDDGNVVVWATSNGYFFTSNLESSWDVTVNVTHRQHGQYFGSLNDGGLILTTGIFMSSGGHHLWSIGNIPNTYTIPSSVPSAESSLSSYYDVDNYRGISQYSLLVT